MMSKKLVCFMFSLVFAVVFAATGIYAGTEVADVFKMETKEYATRTKGLVEFTHKKHVEDYGIKCGDCHHDDKGKALDLKAGDNVQRCVECHKETEKAPKGEKLKKNEKIAKYHKEALHANCIDCHKDFNKEKGYKGKDPKAAPQSCASCHPKK
ncbi:Cytochrome c, class III family protein [Desulfamplus magnetovallimortis]|uniref:Cytochrome c, class III family protein n=1 Tax=Desulfamplus magnetovallimortis TaxID=1246637 RepID=A0A1W1HB86_9BACT|nr:cytochrome c3 family protein [Desulfamplus magnetovallimortis]SLM29747.1 Cytochrome c, class III family protein [Desulfamplus magnetovallimortis]